MDGPGDTTTPKRLHFLVKTYDIMFKVSAFCGLVHTRKSFSRLNTLESLLLTLTRNKKGERKNCLGCCVHVIVCSEVCRCVGGKQFAWREHGPPLCGNDKPRCICIALRACSCTCITAMCIVPIVCWDLSKFSIEKITDSYKKRESVAFGGESV